MAKSQDLRSLPSKVILPDGVVSLDTLNREDRAAIQAQICASINHQLTVYYTSRPKEWSAFLSALKNSE